MGLAIGALLGGGAVLLRFAMLLPGKDADSSEVLDWWARYSGRR